MTPPRPTAPTAAELLREFQDRYHSTGYVREPLLALDRLVAAVRAEALEEAAQRCEAVAWSGEYPEPNYFGCGALVSAEKVRAMVSK